MQDRYEEVFGENNSGFNILSSDGIIISCFYVKPRFGKRISGFQVVLLNGETCEEILMNEIIEQHFSFIMKQQLSYIIEIKCDDISSHRVLIELQICVQKVVFDLLKDVNDQIDDLVVYGMSDECNVQLHKMYAMPMEIDEITENPSNVIDLDDLPDEQDLENVNFMSRSSCKCDRCSITHQFEPLPQCLPDLNQLYCKFWMCEKWLSTHEIELFTFPVDYDCEDVQFLKYIPKDGLAKERWEKQHPNEIIRSSPIRKSTRLSNAKIEKNKRFSVLRSSNFYSKSPPFNYPKPVPRYSTRKMTQYFNPTRNVTYNRPSIIDDDDDDDDVFEILKRNEETPFPGPEAMDTDIILSSDDECMSNKDVSEI